MLFVTLPGALLEAIVFERKGLGGGGGAGGGESDKRVLGIGQWVMLSNCHSMLLATAQEG